jgi:hypothetical protein
MADWYVIKNDKGRVCDPKKGGCGKVHEYWTHHCRPIAFDKPMEWEIFHTEQRQEKGITLVADETIFYASRLGGENHRKGGVGAPLYPESSFPHHLA